MTLDLAAHSWICHQKHRQWCTGPRPNLKLLCIKGTKSRVQRQPWEKVSESHVSDKVQNIQGTRRAQQ